MSKHEEETLADKLSRLRTADHGEFEDLDLDLKACLRSPRELYHPLLINLDVFPSFHAYLNRIYLQKRQMADDAWKARDWYEYVFLHERPYRFDALQECVDERLRGTDYWSLVIEIWTDSENIYQYRREWRRTWEAKEPGRLEAMTEEEREAHSHLGLETTIWRGTNYRKSVSGLSWTTDRKKAESFARRFHVPGRRRLLLATGSVVKSDVLATIFRRNEDEIVCRRVRINTVEELPA